MPRPGASPVRRRARRLARYVAGRLTYAMTITLGVIALSFLLFHVIPSDPARTQLGAAATEQQVASLRHQMGLDQTLPVQLLTYGKRIVRLDLGRSFVDDRPVAWELAGKLTTTATVAAIATLFIMCHVALVCWGTTVAGARPAISTINFALTIAPTMAVGIFLALLVARYYPFASFSGAPSSWQDWLFLVPPAFVLATYPMGILGSIAQRQIEEIDRAAYVVAARARGLGTLSVLRSHVMPNAMVPLLSAFGNQLPLLLTSAFIVEIIYSVPGLGMLLLKSVLARDLPMLEGLVLLSAVVTIIVTFALEALYPILDPRISGVWHAHG